MPSPFHTPSTHQLTKAARQGASVRVAASRRSGDRPALCARDTAQATQLAGLSFSDATSVGAREGRALATGTSFSDLPDDDIFLIMKLALSSNASGGEVNWLKLVNKHFLDVMEKNKYELRYIMKLTKLFENNAMPASLRALIRNFSLRNERELFELMKDVIRSNPSQKTVSDLKDAMPRLKEVLELEGNMIQVDCILAAGKLEIAPTMDKLEELKQNSKPHVVSYIKEHTWPVGEDHPYLVVMGTMIESLTQTDGMTSIRPPSEAGLRVIPDNSFSRSSFSDLHTVDLTACDELSRIGRNAFSYCFSVTSLLLPTNPKELVEIGPCAFEYSPLTTLNLTGCSSLVSMGKDAFRESKLTTLQLEGCAALKSIGPRMFERSILTNLNLSGCAALETIATSAFFGSVLKTLTLNGCAALVSIGDFAFYSSDLTELNLSDCTALKRIGISAFSKSKLTSLVLRGCVSLENIGISAFENTPLIKFRESGCSESVEIGEGAFFNPIVFDLSGVNALKLIRS